MPRATTPLVMVRTGGLGLHTEESPRRKDLLRWTVHLLVAVHLLPTICLVILVSLIGVTGGKLR
jgi:hypothetical protein